MSGAIAVWLVGLTCCAEPAAPHPLTNPESELMLDLPGSGADPTKIDFAALPVLAGRHAVVSVGDRQWQFRLHNYLARHDDPVLLQRIRELAADPQESQVVRLTARQVLERV